MQSASTNLSALIIVLSLFGKHDIYVRVEFYFPSNLFYFRSSAILIESSNTTDFNNFFSLFCTTFLRCLSVLDYDEISNVSKNCIWCDVESQSLKISHGDSCENIFNNSK